MPIGKAVNGIHPEEGSTHTTTEHSTLNATDMKKKSNYGNDNGPTTETMADSQIKQKKMLDALKWCNDNDKSTEFTIEFIADEANCTHDEAVDFLMKT